MATERNETLGKTVGYSIRMESVRSANTRLLLCTTGACYIMLCTHHILWVWDVGNG